LGVESIVLYLSRFSLLHAAVSGYFKAKGKDFVCVYRFVFSPPITSFLFCIKIFGPLW